VERYSTVPVVLKGAQDVAKRLGRVLVVCNSADHLLKYFWSTGALDAGRQLLLGVEFVVNL
jgi:hypothetical protein